MSNVRRTYDEQAKHGRGEIGSGRHCGEVNLRRSTQERKTTEWSKEERRSVT